MTEPVWDEIYEKLPTAPGQKDERLAMFDTFDPNGNGILSLAEVDKAIRDVLAIDEIFDAKPAIMRAFQAAKACGKGRPDVGDDYIEKLEFKRFLLGLRMYFEYWVAFKRIDADDDRRISFEEFSAAEETMKKWISSLGDLQEEFDTIDENDGGMILFSEFCKWAIGKSLDLEDDDD